MFVTQVAGAKHLQGKHTKTDYALISKINQTQALKVCPLQPSAQGCLQRLFYTFTSSDGTYIYVPDDHMRSVCWQTFTILTFVDPSVAGAGSP